jgi:hypothetical protein
MKHHELLLRALHLFVVDAVRQGSGRHVVVAEAVEVSRVAAVIGVLAELELGVVGVQVVVLLFGVLQFLDSLFGKVDDEVFWNFLPKHKHAVFLGHDDFRFWIGEDVRVGVVLGADESVQAESDQPFVKQELK